MTKERRIALETALLGQSEWYTWRITWKWKCGFTADLALNILFFAFNDITYLSFWHISRKELTKIRSFISNPKNIYGQQLSWNYLSKTFQKSYFDQYINLIVYELLFNSPNCMELLEFNDFGLGNGNGYSIINSTINWISCTGAIHALCKGNASASL